MYLRSQHFGYLIMFAMCTSLLRHRVMFRHQSALLRGLVGRVVDVLYRVCGIYKPVDEERMRVCAWWIWIWSHVSTYVVSC